MNIISFESVDLDETLQMVNRSHFDIDGWDMTACQIDRGRYAAVYTGTVYYDTGGYDTGNWGDYEELPLHAAQPASESSKLPASLSKSPAAQSSPAAFLIAVSHQGYAKRLLTRASAPHRYLALLIPLPGKGFFRYNGELVKPGQLIVFPPGQESEFVIPPGFEFLTIRIQQAKFIDAMALIGKTKPAELYGIFSPASKALGMLVSEIRYCLSGKVLSGKAASPGPGSPSPSQAVFDTISGLQVLEKLVIALESATIVRSRLRRDSRMRSRLARSVRDHLDANPRRPVSITELCAVAGAKPRTLHYAFRDYFGISPAAYHRLHRLNAARNELKRFDPGEISVSDIAITHGFLELGRFAVDYKTLFAESPSATLAR